MVSDKLGVIEANRKTGTRKTGADLSFASLRCELPSNGFARFNEQPARK
jgi:hypothetical protein